MQDEVVKTIWKFDLKSSCSVKMPEGATILSVGSQYETIRLWALVDPSKPMVTRNFYIYGTGHDVPDAPMSFVGTAQLYNDSLIFHVFEGT